MTAPQRPATVCSMSFNGRYRRGYMRTYREMKREEAEARNAAYRKRSAQTKGGAEDSGESADLGTG